MEAKKYATEQGAVCYWTDSSAGENAPWLVFLPGLTADRSLFACQTEFFTGKANWLVWDAPAHGESRPYPLCFSMDDYARILHAILEKEGVRRPCLVGQSLGGYVAQAFEDLFPGRAAGLIAIDSAPLKRPYYPQWEISLLRHTEGMYRAIPWNWLKTWCEHGVACTPKGRANMRAIMEGYAKQEFCKLSGHGYRMLAEAIQADRPYRITCPALLLCGEKDRAGDVIRFNRKWTAQDKIPLVWVPNAGHNSTVDNPDFVNRQIQEFAESIGTGA